MSVQLLASLSWAIEFHSHSKEAFLQKFERKISRSRGTQGLLAHLRKRLLEGHSQVLDGGGRAIFLGEPTTNQGVFLADLASGRIEELHQIPRTLAPSQGIRVTVDQRRLITLTPEDTHHDRGWTAVTLRDLESGALLASFPLKWHQTVEEPSVEIDEAAGTLVIERKGYSGRSLLQERHVLSLETGALLAHESRDLSSP